MGTRRTNRILAAGAAVWLSIAATASAGDMAEQMLAEHNRVRAAVEVPTLTWSSELADYARRWAEHLRDEKDCEPEHRPTEGPFAQRHGENIYWAGAVVWSNGDREVQQIGPGRVVASWAREAEHYDHATGGCSNICGHYTQMVWSESRQLGCAMAICTDTREQVWVCNYDPPGNREGEKPY